MGDPGGRKSNVSRLHGRAGAIGLNLGDLSFIHHHDLVEVFVVMEAGSGVSRKKTLGSDVVNKDT
jgi:hypothetical protein